MATDDRDLLEVLQAELEFLEKGGYTRSAKSPWRPQFVFQDSPTCPNDDRKHDLMSCNECVLLQFVPPDSRNEKFPCRHIPLNTAGYTVDTFYRLGTQEELEEALAVWLRKTIYKLERERSDKGVEHEAARSKVSAAGAL